MVTLFGAAAARPGPPVGCGSFESEMWEIADVSPLPPPPLPLLLIYIMDGSFSLQDRVNT